MEKVTLPNGNTLDIPSTPRDWELYSRMPKSVEAASELTQALKSAFSEINTTPWTGTYTSMVKYMYPVMKKYSECGACDTEPRCQAEYYLDEYRKILFGMI